jgi:hypothetical protein
MHKHVIFNAGKTSEIFHLFSILITKKKQIGGIKKGKLTCGISHSNVELSNFAEIENYTVKLSTTMNKKKE